MTMKLKDHRLWNDLTELLVNVDTNALVKEHLAACDYKITGYWDENEEFYEEISLERELGAELINISIEIAAKQRWIKLKFLLEGKTPTSEDKQIGELVLVYNENLEFVDENWLLDINSPFLVTKKPSEI